MKKKNDTFTKLYSSDSVEENYINAQWDCISIQEKSYIRHKSSAYIIQLKRKWYLWDPTRNKLCSVVLGEAERS